LGILRGGADRPSNVGARKQQIEPERDRDRHDEGNRERDGNRDSERPRRHQRIRKIEGAIVTGKEK
jgi:hypothetical protein